MTPVSLLSLLDEHPFEPNEHLVHTVASSTTVAEMRELVHHYADALIAAGVRAHDAVVVQLPNGPDVIAAMFAVWKIAAVFAAVNPRSVQSEITAIIDDVRPSAMIDASGVRKLEGEHQTFPPDVAFINYTSGTTGVPKPIRQTHAGYLEFLDRVLGPLRGKAGADDGAGVVRKTPMPNLIPVSIALNAGLYNVLFGLRAGAAVVVMERFATLEFAELVRRFEIRSTVLPPAAIAMLSDDDRVVDLAPLKYVRSITAPLSPLQARRFTEKFSTFVLNSYGQAELGEVIGWTAADAKSFPHKIGALGKPHAGVEVRLDDDGHLLVRPPKTAAGIEDRTDGDGFVDTGDIARIDEDGFVWIEGRVSDMINRGGNKISPAAVEEVLRLSDAVDDVAVVGIADDRLGEVPVAFLVGRELPDDVLQALCREHLVAYKVPVAFHWIDELPRNEIGKVLRNDLINR